METRRKRVGGGFVTQVLNPLTGRWIGSEQYYNRYRERMNELTDIVQAATRTTIFARTSTTNVRERTGSVIADALTDDFLDSILSTVD